jgi:DNA-directed RNA polymerase specialized sigma24 family protein
VHDEQSEGPTCGPLFSDGVRDVDDIVQESYMRIFWAAAVGPRRFRNSRRRFLFTIARRLRRIDWLRP